MKKELNDIILKQSDALKTLLEALERQHSFIVKKDVFGMEKCMTEIEECNRSIAACEVKRRELTQGKSMSQIVEESSDEELDKNYRDIKKLIQETILQKDSNDLLIKQGLSYTNRMLSIMNPDRSAKTYNPYGKMKR